MIGRNTFHIENNLLTMSKMDDNSVDAIVTDCPYGLGKAPDPVKVLQDWISQGYTEIRGGGFMGMKWDSFVPQPRFWQEVKRVLKPGGHVLAFFGTRTYDWGVMSMRIAGFEIRDQLAWVHAEGWPKSQDVSKAIDKAMGMERINRVGIKPGHEDFVGRDHCRGYRQGGNQASAFSRPWMYDRSKVLDQHWRYAPASDKAREWDGWGTALKPAMEPIVMARKPLDGTVVNNVLSHGLGGINIDACRVGSDIITTKGFRNQSGKSWTGSGMLKAGNKYEPSQHQGRWPANVIHDGGDDVMKIFPETRSGADNVKGRSGEDVDGNTSSAYGSESRPSGNEQISYGDSGSAARMFYCAKPGKQERGLYNTHPTVKPIALMRYLVRLITPVQGVVYDPYCGSGTTLVAAKLERIDYIGSDDDEGNRAIITKRLASASRQEKFDFDE